MFVLVIIITLATQQIPLADKIHAFRPINDAMGPAAEELIKAPSIISDEMSCCRSVDMFQPRGVSALCPNTCRKPTMAWRPPMSPKSSPRESGQQSVSHGTRRWDRVCSRGVPYRTGTGTWIRACMLQDISSDLSWYTSSWLRLERHSVIHHSYLQVLAPYCSS